MQLLDYKIKLSIKHEKQFGTQPCYLWGGETWRQLYNRLIESGSKSTFQELVDDQALIIKNLSSIEIKEDKQKLSGGFDSGCWLIFWKN